MTRGRGLEFRFEWEPFSTVQAPELRATWARLEVWADHHCISLVEDLETGSARRSVYGALYPLAEWVAFNWWFLCAHARPSPLGHRIAAAGTRPDAHQRSDAWMAHNLRAAGDGQAWPNLTILPQGRTTHLIWRADHAPATGVPVRFAADGETDVTSEQTQRALSSLVQLVLTRLHEEGIRDTPLAKEWAAIVEADADEAAFCKAAARLGVDPYRVSEKTADRILLVAESLEPPVLDDFLDAVNPAMIDSALRWVTRATERVERASGGHPLALATLSAPVAQADEVAFDTQPWETGYRQARQVRAHIGLPPTGSFDPSQHVEVAHLTTPDPNLIGLGGWSPERVGVVILGKPLYKPSRRFAQARALWHLVHEPDRPRFLIVPAVTERHRTERAFAAELLAPAEGIATLLDANQTLVDEDQTEAISRHFGASTWLVRHQIENQLGIPFAAF